MQIKLTLSDEEVFFIRDYLVSLGASQPDERTIRWFIRQLVRESLNNLK